MRDKDLYAQILGITYPWLVGEVGLRLQEGEVVVHLELAPGHALSCAAKRLPGTTPGSAGGGIWTPVSIARCWLPMYLG